MFPKSPSVLLAALALPVLLLAQQSAAGIWRVEFVTPLGQVGVNMTINQSGTKLTGHVTDEFGEWEIAGRLVDGHVKGPQGELPFTGTLTGSDLKFVFTIQFQGMPLEIAMTGKVENDAMTGKASFGGMADGDWTAKRSTGTAAAAPPPATATP